MLFYTTFTIDADILYIKSGNAATVLRYCTLSVFVLCKHCSGNGVLVRIFFQLRIVATVPCGTVATVVTFFFSFRLFFFFPFIYIVLLPIIYKKRQYRYSILILCTQCICTVQALYR